MLGWIVARLKGATYGIPVREALQIKKIPNIELLLKKDPPSCFSATNGEVEWLTSKFFYVKQAPQRILGIWQPFALFVDLAQGYSSWRSFGHHRLITRRWL
jgi:hypothetical protein